MINLSHQAKAKKIETFEVWCDRMSDKLSLDSIISYMENTGEDEWQMGVCRSKDGKRNCLFGHLFNMGGGDEGEGSNFLDFFEEQYATTYMFFGINDGENPKYPQPTPKQRTIAYLKNLRDGKEKTTQQELDQEYRSAVPNL